MARLQGGLVRQTGLAGYSLKTASMDLMWWLVGLQTTAPAELMGSKGGPAGWRGGQIRN